MEATVKVKLLYTHSRLPRRANPTDAGADLYSTDSVLLMPGERRAVPTGICLEIPVGYEGQIRPRSGLALNGGVTVLNSPGTIDSGFRGEIKVILINHGTEPVTLPSCSRIAQLVIAPVALVPFVEQAGALADSARGVHGFGSTGLREMPLPTRMVS